MTTQRTSYSLDFIRNVTLDHISFLKQSDPLQVSWLPTRLPKHCKIIVSCASEEANPEVSKEYHILRRMIDVEENFIEVNALGEELAMKVIK